MALVKCFIQVTNEVYGTDFSLKILRVKKNYTLVQQINILHENKIDMEFYSFVFINPTGCLKNLADTQDVWY